MPMIHSARSLGGDVLGKPVVQRDLDRFGHAEPGFALSPDTGGFCAVDTGCERVERAGGRCVAVAAHDNVARTRVVAHDLVADAVADVVEALDSLFFDEIADALVVVGELAVGGRGVVIEHDQRLFRVRDVLSAHLAEGLFNAGRVIVGEHDVRLLEDDCAFLRAKYFLDECCHDFSFFGFDEVKTKT